MMKDESSRLASTPHIRDTAFTIREYRSADFDHLWQIDQQCFPPGIAYTQMELSGFITRRNAITLVGEFPASKNAASATADSIAGFVVAHPIRRKYGRIASVWSM